MTEFSNADGGMNGNASGRPPVSNPAHNVLERPVMPTSWS